MGISKYMDCHLHTSNSPDAPATSTTAAMVERACALGLERITVTDHCELNRFSSDHDFREGIANSVRETLELREKYAGRLEVLSGIELGQAPQNFSLAEEMLALHDYSFVIGSIHNARCAYDFSELDFSDTTIDIPHMLDVYFKELYEVTKWGKIDTLAHITYPHRYISGKYGIPIDMGKYWDILDETYKNLIQNGRALEINTSGLRQGMGTTLPSKEYILRFKELGGELVTIGSDAHMPEDLGAGIKEGYEMAAACGFKYICYFEGRVPHMVKI